MPSFKVEGMSCAHCVESVTKAVHEVAPGAEVRVDLASGAVEIGGEARREVLAKAIEDAGYKVLA